MMNRIEKKLRKIKGLYEQLNIKNRTDAEYRAKHINKHWECLFVSFDFSYSNYSETASVELNVYKYTVKYNYHDTLVYGTASGLDYYNLLDLFYTNKPKGFIQLDQKRFNDYIETLTKFVRKALKNGMESMDYGTQTERVKVSNYLDFKEKE